jgi:hypothetical protein
MKKSTTTLLLTILTTFAFGQIDDNLKRVNWKPGKERIIYGNTIFRHEGRNDIRGVLNIGFQTFAQVKADIEQMAEKEMWTPEMKTRKIESYERLSSGGLIHLYLTRLTIDAANTNMFTVIIKDSTDNNEILRLDLKRNIPNTPLISGSNYWWNYTTIPIPDKINGNIYIYIIDKLGGDNNKFKFELKL